MVKVNKMKNQKKNVYSNTGFTLVFCVFFFLDLFLYSIRAKNIYIFFVWEFF